MSASNEFGVVVRIEQDSMTTPAGVSPSIPQPGKYKQGTVVHPEVERLLFFPAARPLKNPVRRKQAPTACEGIAEGGLARDRFGACIDCLEADAGVRGPGRNQAPASQREVTLRCRWILPNDTYWLRGCNVVARLPIDLVVGVEVFGDQLLASGKTIAATHLSLLRSSNNVMELTNRRDTYSACWDPESPFWR